MFLSSHLLAEVEQVCDEVAVIHKGRLIQQGPIQAAIRVVVDPAAQDAALALLSRWSAKAAGPGALLVGTGDGRAVNEVLGQAGIWAREIVASRLEEAFLEMTGS